MFRAPARLRLSHALWLAAGVTLLVIACGPGITAPDNSTIKLSASPTSISLSGSTTITATVTTASGNPVEEGTQVTFETTLGTLTATQPRTRTGQAVTQLNARGQGGTATVRASSGSARSDGLDIVIGGALTLTLRADATTVNIGSQVTFTATTTGPPVSEYQWDFGDPNHPTTNTKTTTTGSTIYIFVSAGSFTVTVKAVAQDGSSRSAQVTITAQ
jgi:hypothetical protein